GLDAVANPPRVLPHGRQIEHAGEPKLREHLLKLTAQFGRRDRRRIRPLSFEEVHVAVPKPGRNREARTIERLDSLRNRHNRSATHCSYLSALDEHHAVRYWLFCGTGIDRPSHQSQVTGSHTRQAYDSCAS